MPVKKWETNIIGYFGVLKAEIKDGTPPPESCDGTLTMDGLQAETLADTNITSTTISFRRIASGQIYDGVINGDQILGTFTDSSGLDYSWEARQTNRDEGIYELGDYDQNGLTNNMDIVRYLEDYDLMFHTYRICDGIYNPVAFNLVNHPPEGLNMDSPNWTWRPDGLPKTIAPEMFNDYIVAAVSYPVEKLPIIRSFGKIFLDTPKRLIEGVFKGNGWHIDISGVLGPVNLSSYWHISANNYRGYLFLASLERGNGRAKFEESGKWEALYNIKKLSANKIRFKRVLKNGTEQIFTGTISGNIEINVLGNKVEGTFSHDGKDYSWTGSGKIYDIGKGISDLTIVANGYSAKLKICLGGSWVGRIYLAANSGTEPDFWKYPERWEKIDNITLTENDLRFYRPQANQYYTGTINGEQVSGIFTSKNKQYIWSGGIIHFEGGTCLGGSSSEPIKEIGTVTKMIWNSVFSSPNQLVEESFGHPLNDLIVGAKPPFTQEDKRLYDKVGFQSAINSMTPSNRPVGFMSSYAASGNEDFANTYVAYLRNRSTLWSFIWEDRNNHKSTLLGNKFEFIRKHVIKEARLDGPWKINANGHLGRLVFNIKKDSPPVLTGVICFDNIGKTENLQQLSFNGVTIRFHRIAIDGIDQYYVGVLKGNEIRGIFTHGDTSASWNATAWIAADYEDIAGSSEATMCERSIQIFLKSFDQLKVKRWDETGWQWEEHGTPYATKTDSAPRVVSIDFYGIQRHYAFVKGIDGHLHLNYWNGHQWQWSDRDRPKIASNSIFLSSAPSVIAYESNQKLYIYAFIMSEYGRLFVHYWNGSGWLWSAQGENGIPLLPNTLLTNFEPAAISYNENGSQRIYVFLVATNGHLIVNYWNGLQWLWADHGIPNGSKIVGPPTAIVSKQGTQLKIKVFAAGDNGHLYEHFWDELGWHWKDHGWCWNTNEVGSSAIYCKVNAVCYIESGKLKTYAFAQSGTNLKVRYDNGYQWNWATQEGKPIGTLQQLNGAVTYCENDIRRIMVFIRIWDGSHARLYANHWTGSTWAWADLGII